MTIVGFGGFHGSDKSTGHGNETETAEHRQLVLLLKNQHTLDCLDDALLLAALGWLDAPSLCFMGATSRRLYCIAHASML